MDILDLVKIRQCADDACDAAWGDETVKGEAINWGDLGCVSAEYYVTEEGHSGVRVLIEEAAPTCHNLKNLIADYLSRHGFDGIEVVTEW